MSGAASPETSTSPPGTSLDVVVLAGGASRRMGTDKALLVIDGRRLVDHVAARMATVADRVMVARGARPLGRDDEVADVPDCGGPLSGVLAALRAGGSRHLGVVPVDAPGTDPRMLPRLAAICATHGRAATAAVVDGRLQALHAVLARTALPAVEARVADGESSPRALLAWLDALLVDVDGWGDLDPTGALARDWDVPADLPHGRHVAATPGAAFRPG